ncbi:MAG: FAD-binding protein [Nitrososphaerota archaeon]
MDKIIIISTKASSIEYIYQKIKELFPKYEFYSILISKYLEPICIEKTFFIKSSYLLSIDIKELTQIVREISPKFVFSSSDILTKSLASMIATELECGILSDIDEIYYESGDINFSKPYIKGLKALLSSKTVPTIITIPCISNYTSNNLNKFIPKEISIKNIFNIELEEKEEESISLEKAKKIVCIGRGVRKEDIPKIYEFAKSIGAIVGYTRPAREEFGAEHSLQIGITGKIISPDLYITFGVSGKEYHIKGVINPKTVISINTDPNAPIKEYSDYFIISDYRNFIDRLK